MRGLIVYSSRTGGTERLARGLYKNLKVGNWELYNVRNAPDPSEYDIIMIGFWVFRGSWDPLTANYIKNIKQKNIFIFGTIGAYDDGHYARRITERCVREAESRENNVRGTFICMGALDRKRIEQKAKEPEKFLHPVTEEKLIRLDVFSHYPTEAEIAVCGERFNNRLLVMKRRGEFS